MGLLLLGDCKSANAISVLSFLSVGLPFTICSNVPPYLLSSAFADLPPCQRSISARRNEMRRSKIIGGSLSDVGNAQYGSFVLQPNKGKSLLLW